eukprot:Nk52_evm67s239 gene=Nk52_evmTU67s239
MLSGQLQRSGVYYFATMRFGSALANRLASPVSVIGPRSLGGSLSGSALCQKQSCANALFLRWSSTKSEGPSKRDLYVQRMKKLAKAPKPKTYQSLPIDDLSPKSLSTNLLQYYGYREMAKREKEIKIPHVYPGTILRVTIQTMKRFKPTTFVGYVTAVKNRGHSTRYFVRNVISGVGIVAKIPIYSPYVKSFEVVRYDRKRQSKLYYFAKKPDKEVTVKRDITH